MIVGLTYDLRSEYLLQGYTDEETAEFDRDETIEGIEKALQTLGYKTDRIGNIKQLTSRLEKGNRWDFVFNIAEGMYGVAREAQVPALLDAYNIPYVFSDPLVLALTLHKGFTKHIVKDLGLPTPAFKVVSSIKDIDKLSFDYPMFAKPVAEGTGKGITAESKILDFKSLKATCSNLLKTYNQPILVEEYLPGREFTIGIVGNGSEAKVIGIMEILYEENTDHEFYSFHNKENYETFIRYRKTDEKKIVAECTELALAIWNGLGCRDGGRMDVRMDKNGTINFIEVNPLAGLRPVHSDLVILAEMNGIEYNKLIEMIVNTAIKRMKK